MAHVIGATSTPGSPRGLEAGHDDTVLEGEENLLLCCHDCHRMIDHPDHVAFFTPAKLRALKGAHEQRIEMATSDGVLTRTAVLRVGSYIRGTWAVASRREVADTLFANDYLGLVESHWSGQFTCELQGRATDPSYWTAAEGELKRSLDTIGRAVAQGDVGHVSVFAIAPVPALVLLGSLLDDKIETRIWQKRRDAGWNWANASEPTTFAFDQDDGLAPSAANVASRDVVLICSLSAEVSPARLPQELQDAPRFVLRPRGCHPVPHAVHPREVAGQLRLGVPRHAGCCRACASLAPPGGTSSPQPRWQPPSRPAARSCARSSPRSRSTNEYPSTTTSAYSPSTRPAETARPRSTPGAGREAHQLLRHLPEERGQPQQAEAGDPRPADRDQSSARSREA